MTSLLFWSIVLDHAFPKRGFFVVVVGFFYKLRSKYLYRTLKAFVNSTCILLTVSPSFRIVWCD